MTEFDEQMADKNSALIILRSKVREVLRGEETYGVLHGYEAAAYRHGVTENDIARIWEEEKN